MQKNLIIALIFAIIVAIFSIQNAGPVSLAFFSWEFSTSLVVVVLGSAVLGAVIMWIISSFKLLKINKEKRKLKKEISDLEEERENLKVKVNELKSEPGHMKNTNKKSGLKNKNNDKKDNNEDDLNNNV